MIGYDGLVGREDHGLLASALRHATGPAVLRALLKVSIIDDDSSVRTATGSLLRSFGWEVQLFESAESYLRTLGNGHTDCIISDVQMPGMSGLELQDHLASRNDTTPMLFISAFHSDTLCERAVAAGALGFLRKPVDGPAISHYLDALASKLHAARAVDDS